MNQKEATSSTLISREDCVLVVIDVQEKLLPAVADKETVLNNVVRLIKFAGIIDLPVVLTEQRNLGPTVPEVGAELAGVEPISKITFDCFGEDAFQARLEAINRKVLVLAGIEAHICVAQTALTALNRFMVHTVGDAVSSRSLHNKDVALARMRQAGAVVTSTEMVIYELLRRAGTPEFKEALKLVK